ncbi:MAG: Asparagine synthetase [glutamine-hydrolyzing] 1 [Steroidobacteraceae bacterium]|nr:Asparagine synthetase [glutamine-hydrolyzing] 1 [Steroidobacteraceae bacterium]
MCGIAGILNLEPGAPVRRDVLAAMLAPLANRGPDGQGTYLAEPELAGLAHARLSIIDLAGGAQPIHNEDGTVQVVFNGEIFNYVELRAALEKAGHRFYTRTDTEVLVHLYEEHGLRFVDHLNGQFAIALWDVNARRLVLARDRAGILPLFHARDGGRLVFASEIKSLLKGLSRKPTLNRAALDQVFTFWSPVGSATMFDGVEQLPPGHLLVAEQGRVHIERYWDWTFSAPGEYRRGAVADLARELDTLLTDATRIRLRADVPVGAYLSGGLDSTALVALMCEGGVKPNTFSLAFEDPGLDESVYQQEAAAFFGVHHRTIRVGNEDIRAGFVQTVYRAETPFLRCAPIPLMSLSRLAHASDCKVVMTGEGSDEVFGGYDLFKEAKIRRFWARQPGSKWRARLLQRLYPYLDITAARGQAYSEAFFGSGLDAAGAAFFAHEPRWRTTAQGKALFSEETRQCIGEEAVGAFARSLPEGFGAWDPFNQSQYVEAKTLLANYLLSTQGDRMLMANSVEGRFPYLDHRVIELANSLDPRLKMHVLNEKYLLKRAVDGRLPPAILTRKKQPYRSPDSRAFEAERDDFVADALSEASLRQAGYFDPGRTQLLVRKVRAGRAVSYKDSMTFIGILSTQVWHRLFVDGVTPGTGGL